MTIDRSPNQRPKTEILAQRIETVGRFSTHLRQCIETMASDEMVGRDVRTVEMLAQISKSLELTPDNNIDPPRSCRVDYRNDYDVEEAEDPGVYIAFRRQDGTTVEIFAHGGFRDPGYTPHEVNDGYNRAYVQDNGHTSRTLKIAEKPTIVSIRVNQGQAQLAFKYRQMQGDPRLEITNLRVNSVDTQTKVRTGPLPVKDSGGKARSIADSTSGFIRRLMDLRPKYT